MASEWIAPEVERQEPQGPLGERDSLEAWLDYHRATLLAKCAGLNETQLKRRSVAPSKLSLLGLVRHMTEVERWWFRIHAGDEDMTLLYSSDENPEGDFEADAADAPDDFEAFHEEIELARQVAAGRQLDDVVRSHGHHPGETDVRWIYVHMIEEYARHNGHADLLRETIDGATGD
jgi:hypothetical protein